MKKFLLLLAIFVTGVSTAFATPVTIKCNLADAIKYSANAAVSTYNWQLLGDTEITIQAGTYDFLCLTPADGYSIKSATYSTTGSYNISKAAIPMTAGYYMLSLNDSYTSYTIEVTAESDNPSETSGLTYTFSSNEPVLSFSCYGITLNVTENNGVYTVKGMSADNYQSITVTCADGYSITGITDESGSAVEDTYGNWLIDVDSYPENTAFAVTVEKEAEEESFDYTIECAADILSFTQTIYSPSIQTLEVDAPYANGAYTISGLTSSSMVITGQIKDGLSGYSLTNVTVKDGSPLRIEENQFQISPYSYQEATTFVVTYTTVDVVTGTVTIEVDSPANVSRVYNSKFTWTPNSNNPFSYDLTDGMTLSVDPAYGYAIESVKCGDVSLVAEGTDLPSPSPVTFDLSALEDGATIYITTGEYDDSSAIGSITTGSIEEVKAVFDLFGRRVNGTPAPGIYVVDGVKTVIR